MKKYVVIASVILVVAVAGFFGYKYLNKNDEVKNDNTIVSGENNNQNEISGEENDTDRSSGELNYSGETNGNDIDNEKEPTAEEVAYKKAEAYLKQMTLDEKIGQLFLVRFPTENASKIVSENYFGGYLLFGRDFKDKTKDQVIAMIDEVQKNSKTPLITAVDEEGGTVVRISSNKNLANEKFKSPSQLYNEGGFELIRQDTIDKSNLLKELGINLNLAPVVDISDPSDYMYERTLKQGVDLTKEFAKTVIEASKDTGVSYALKHFPGYGHNDDTHESESSDTRTYDEIINQAVPPFEEGIKAGAEAILISHNKIECMDGDNPASISKTVHDFLRDTLHYNGIIITDDLSMGAVANVEDVYIKAVNSGNNLIITSDYQTAIKQVKDAIEDGKITEEQLDELVVKTLAWKYYKNLMV